MSENKYHPIVYCPYCGEKFNIIEKLKDFADYMAAGRDIHNMILGHTGIGKSSHMKSIANKDVVIIDHMSLMEPKTVPNKYEEQMKMLKEMMKKHYGKTVVLDNVSSLLGHHPIETPPEKVMEHIKSVIKPTYQKKNPEVNANSEPWRRRGK
jgi:hypothetical protein